MSRTERGHKDRHHKGRDYKDRDDSDSEATENPYITRNKGKSRDKSIPRTGSGVTNPARTSGPHVPHISTTSLSMSPGTDPNYMPLSTHNSRHGTAPTQVMPIHRPQGTHDERFPPSLPRARSHDDTGPATARPATERLSDLGHRFAQIGLGQYGDCERFILDHNTIRTEPHKGFIDTAVAAIREQRIGDAQRCVQQCLILRRCDELGRKRFFDRMDEKDEDTVKDFIDDFKRIFNQLKHRATNPSGLSDSEGSREPLPPRTSRPHPSRSQTGTSPRVSGITQGLATVSFTDPPPAERHDAPTNLPPISESIGSSASPPNRVSGQQVQPGIVRHETMSTSGTHNSAWSEYTNPRPFESSILVKSRRMVVVTNERGRSMCLPVTTYNLRGLNKRGLTQDEVNAHAIIYMADTRPTCVENERRSIKRAIAVNPAQPDQKLHPISRVNFSKFHTVEHNEKVLNVGKVTEESMPYFVNYFRERLRKLSGDA